jgi:hypothetical protein
MNSGVSEFDVLHGVRLRGVASTEALALRLDVTQVQVQTVIDVLLSGGQLIYREGRRVSGYVLTQEGKGRHAQEIAEQANGLREEMSKVYKQFLALNGRIKGMCSDWQEIDDDTKRWVAIDELETFHAAAQVIFKRAGVFIPRYSQYGQALLVALELLVDGDYRYFTSPLVDSYHTVWFEVHEDFLMCLGIDRAAEGSF